MSGTMAETATSTRFSIAAWGCWAPGCEDAPAWRAWCDGGAAPAGTGQPDLSAVNPMQRRRLSPVARAAFGAAARCLRDPANTATVFISTYGQGEQSLKLLETLAAGQPVSPAAFSLSVHNAVAGLFSIVHGLRGPSLSLGAGVDGLATAFLEAAGILFDREASDVLVVGFEDILPAAQQPFEPNPPAAMAAAFLVRPGGDPQARRVELRRTPGRLAPQPFWLQLRDLIGWLESRDRELVARGSRSMWVWREW